MDDVYADQSSLDGEAPSASWATSVAPGDPDGDTCNTVSLAECNDCTLGRLAEAMQTDGRVAAGPGGDPLALAPFRDAPLHMNIVGLRVHGTVSNKFDDRMVVFYRPIDLASPTTVEDPDTLAAAGVDVAAVEQFLGDPNFSGALALQGNELPGDPSTDAECRECRVHTGWKVLVLPITTDPGWQKKPNAETDVPVGNGEGSYLAQGRAQLVPARYADSHRLGVHHWNRPDGYTAASQSGNVGVLRGYTGKYLREKVEALATSWEKAWKAYAKKHKTETPNDTWMRSYLSGPIGLVHDVREASLMGAVIGHDVTVRFTLSSTEAPNPKTPGATITTWQLAVNGLFTGDRAMADTDVATFRSTSDGINLHASNDERRSKVRDPSVYNWSEGCQVQKGMANFEMFRALLELSKRARCSKRCAATLTCPSIAHPVILEQDVVANHFNDKTSWSEYTSARANATEAQLTAMTDAMLDARWAEGKLGSDLDAVIEARIETIEFHASPAVGEPSSPVPTLSKTMKKPLASDVASVVDAHLLPGDENDAVRAGVSTKGLVAKLEAYLTADIACDPAVKEVIDAAVAALPKGRKASTVLGHAEVQAAITASVATHKEACLAKLATELDAASADLADQKQLTFDRIRTTRAATAERWTREGYEHCDLFWACSMRFSYTLAEVEQAYVDEIDARTPPR